MAFTKDTIAGDNICVIWVDDMFDINVWRDAYGVRIQTPNIDRIMKAGVTFSNTYATVPLCSPCRAELATGLSPFRTGLVDLNRIWREALPPQAAWAFDLRRAGFHTFTTGKVDGKYQPMSEGYRRLLFDQEREARDNPSRRENIEKYLVNDGPKIWGVNHPEDDGSQDAHFYDYDVAQNAIDFLGEADPARRHLIQLGFKHPHLPYVCPDRFYQMYDPLKIKWPDAAEADDFYGPASNAGGYERTYIANGPFIPEKIGASKWQQVVRGYFAACSHVDYHIGRFLDALAASPLADTTTVIFLSDNGFNLGTHDSFHKMSQWDSAAHIPFGIWSPRMEKAKVIDTPVSLHNFAKTVMQLAGLPPRSDWVSGQSVLPLIDASFGSYDLSKSPLTTVFGTLSVRPSVPGLEHLRYFRYPDGEEHVYDLVRDPGETENIVESAPTAALRAELVGAALELGLDLRGHENPADGVNAMMSLDGTVVLKGTRADNDYWVYGDDAEAIEEDEDGGTDTLWYMGGPDDYVLKCPANVEKVRIAAVLARHEDETHEGRRPIHVVAHPDTPIHFETSERVEVDVTGSRLDDVLIGPAYGDATLRGGDGDDTLIAVSKTGSMTFFGDAGNDYLKGGEGDDYLDGGTGDDVIFGGRGANTLVGGYGNDRIVDGPGASRIFTGAGSNEIHLNDGDDEVFVGPGINKIFPGGGAVTFHIAFGGLTFINRWRPQQVYRLVNWPADPLITQLGEGLFEMSLGRARLRINRVRRLAKLREQLVRVDS
ncbi:MAG: sulfatase-like hydrolase/transferase [Pseudomonadota bacterium]